MSMPDDHHNDIAPPQADDRLGGGSRRSPRSRPDESRGERAEVRSGLLASLMGGQSGTRGLMLLGVIGAALLLGIGGVWSWMASHHPSGVPVIGPPPYPVKDRPADPGGMMVMGDDTTKSDVTGRGAVHLAPPPEQPDASMLAGRLAPSASGPGAGEAAQKVASANSGPAGDAVSPGKQVAAPGGDADAGKGGVTQGGDIQSTSLPPDDTADQTAKGDVADKGASSATVSAPKKREPSSDAGDEADEADNSPDEASSRVETPKRKTPPARKAAGDDVSDEALPPPVPARAKPATPMVSSEGPRRKAAETGAAGRYEVQLAALASEDQARQEWSRLRHRLPDLLGGYDPVYRKVERDGKTFIRLRIGGFEDRAAARQLCVRLHAQAQACAVATN
ncbi:SPOR domain-containing protein [Bombella apis]|uniref:SPOR domain-containing protein n=1 Tax=Bombella apis TaxID=1785988 RepID=UPI0024A96349|nr:SPOR domain-containing protein [Bombella apis]